MEYKWNPITGFLYFQKEGNGMSYIVPKDIPNCCGNCPYNYSSLMCKITKSEIDRDDEYRERLKDCPLVEVNTGMTVEEIARGLKEMRN